MKKFALKTIAAILFVSTSLLSCSDDEESEIIITRNEFATEVTGPETGTLNQEITFNVTFNVQNSCGNFYKFAETISGNTKTIQVQSIYNNSDCGNTIVSKTQPYKFMLNTAGTYTFKFKSSESAYITKTVVIE